MLHCRNSRLIILIIALLLVFTGCSADAGKDEEHDFEKYATIEAYCNNVPVYSLGNIVYLYGIGPDILPGVVMQEGNINPVVKVKPKKSWEIKNSLCGATAGEPSVRTIWNDDQAFLPIHLIDGDPDTIWMAYGSPVPDERPEWIRIDLPIEANVAAVNIICPKVPLSGAYFSAGKVLPKELTIKVSRDAWHWETVYENKDFKGDNSGPNLIKFEMPKLAKQIMIVGNNLQGSGLYWIPYTFSIGEVELLDGCGNNLALVSRGTGVSVSSTGSFPAKHRYTEDSLYVPLMCDLGYRWVRMGLDNGMLLWMYVEREKGKLQVDTKTDAMISELQRNNIDLIMVLDYKSNWIYRNPPQRVDWKKDRTREVFSPYMAYVGNATDSKEELEGYVRYVKYMAEHFKGRVTYFEIGNEWNNSGWFTDSYMQWFEAVYKAIKEVNPDAKILFGSPGGTGNIESCYPSHYILNCLGEGSGVKDGKMVLPGRAMMTVASVSTKDVAMSIDVKGDAEVGFVIRSQRDKARSLDTRFILAGYDHSKKAIVFHEPPADGTKTYAIQSGVDLTLLTNPKYMHVVPAEGLSGQVHLTAQVKGNKITLTASAGKKSVTGSYDIKGLVEPGMFGLYNCPWRPQSLLLPAEFKNFEIRDVSGKTIFADKFDKPGRRADKWNLFWDYWSDTRGDNPILAKRVDAVGWHPSIFPDAAYAADLKQFKADCKALGFKGKFMVTELYENMIYPPGSLDGSSSDIQMAKRLARYITSYAGLGMATALYCNTYQCSCPEGTSLLRVPNPVDTVHPMEPNPAYYMMRNLTTMMDDLNAQEFPVVFSGDRKLDYYTFKKGDGQLIVSAWLPGKAIDGIAEAKTDITFPGVKAKKAWVEDIINGTEQELNISKDGNNTVIKGVLIKDYPTLIRLENKQMISSSDKNVILESDKLKVVFDPKNGGRIREFISKGSGKQYLFVDPRTDLKGPGFGDTDISGICECFPTVGQANYPDGKYKGQDMGDHGWLWQQAWNVDITPGSVKMSADVPQFKCKFERKCSIENEDTLLMDYTITNYGDVPFKYIYSTHALFNTGKDTQIIFPKETNKMFAYLVLDIPGVVQGKWIDWPSKNSHLNLPLSTDKASAIKLFSDKLSEGRITLYNRDLKEGVQMDFDTNPLLSQGYLIYQGYGGLKDSIFVGLEPSTGIGDDPATCASNGTLQQLKPGEAKQFRIKLKLVKNL